MTDLLALAVEAHGGLERRNTVKSIERVVTTFADKDVRTTFEPDRVLIEKKDGTLIESRSAALPASTSPVTTWTPAAS